MKRKKDFKNNEYTGRIRIKPKRRDWLEKNKGGKTAAQFLDELIESFASIKKLF